MSEQRRRARELGIEIGIYPTGPYNAITDVVGVEVGHTTVHWGDANLPAGQGPARSGVTAIWPQREGLASNPVAAGFFALSGTGEMTGRSEIEELGRTGSTGGDTSGELLIAFSTGYRPGQAPGAATRPILESYAIDPIFEAAIDATEEAVLNALCMSATTDGVSGRRLRGIPLDELQRLLG